MATVKMRFNSFFLTAERLGNTIWVGFNFNTFKRKNSSAHGVIIYNRAVSVSKVNLGSQ